MGSFSVRPYVIGKYDECRVFNVIKRHLGFKYWCTIYQFSNTETITLQKDVWSSIFVIYIYMEPMVIDRRFTVLCMKPCLCAIYSLSLYYVVDLFVSKGITVKWYRLNLLLLILLWIIVDICLIGNHTSSTYFDILGVYCFFSGSWGYCLIDTFPGYLYLCIYKWCGMFQFLLFSAELSIDILYKNNIEEVVLFA